MNHLRFILLNKQERFIEKGEHFIEKPNCFFQNQVLFIAFLEHILQQSTMFFQYIDSHNTIVLRFFQKQILRKTLKLNVIQVTLITFWSESDIGHTAT